MTEKERGWFRRNAKWVLPLGCVGAIVVLVVAVLGIFLVVAGTMRMSDAYTQGLAAARADSRVIEALGEPIEPGFLVLGSVEVNGPSGQADISIPLEGPKGSGTLFVVAEKEAGLWTFEVLEVEVEGRPGRIVLQPDPESTLVESETGISVGFSEIRPVPEGAMEKG